MSLASSTFAPFRTMLQSFSLGLAPRTLALTLFFAPVAFMATALPVTAAPAQRVAKSFVECPSQGFQFKPLDKFDSIPVDSSRGGETVLRMGQDQSTITAYAAANQVVEGKAKKGESVAKKARRSVTSIIADIGYRGLSKKDIKNPTIEEEVEIEGLTVKHLQFNWVIRSEQPKSETPVVLDVWSYPLDHADIHIAYFIAEELDSKLEKALRSSAESFELIERIAEVEIDVSERTYESQMEWAEQEAAKTPGWQAIGTPSERFVILTNAEKMAFVKEVIERLEISRDIYEQDFPPPAGFDAVSVVRICANADEFHKFSGTPRGVAGYFSPSSVELVMYDNLEVDRNSTYAVVSHEAFHQYCHFLFNQSEAHRWFDEGHGDYYGGLKIRGKRGKITPKMPSGLDRLSVIRGMVRDDQCAPLVDHLNFTHTQWQGQGPSGVSCYAQSWSIIYMLRQGALRKVNRKVWKDEYADILPNYVRTLNGGFEAAYEKIRVERVAKAKKDGKELDPEDLKINRFDLDPRDKNKIWEDAMAASWGQIDLDEFEASWKLYIEKYLKQ
ncbi:MAG: hypothetical protein ACJA2W_003165 [Planctomycetota bacterium]|jgi:hypothetical protein